MLLPGAHPSQSPPPGSRRAPPCRGSSRPTAGHGRCGRQARGAAVDACRTPQLQRYSRDDVGIPTSTICWIDGTASTSSTTRPSTHLEVGRHGKVHLEQRARDGLHMRAQLQPRELVDQPARGAGVGEVSRHPRLARSHLLDIPAQPGCVGPGLASSQSSGNRRFWKWAQPPSGQGSSRCSHSKRARPPPVDRLAHLGEADELANLLGVEVVPAVPGQVLFLDLMGQNKEQYSGVNRVGVVPHVRRGRRRGWQQRRAHALRARAALLGSHPRTTLESAQPQLAVEPGPPWRGSRTGCP